jgi:hypothetical protein
MCKKLICLTAALLLVSSALASAASPGPVGWWKFDETAGTTAADSIGGRNGTLLPPDPDGKGLGPKWVPGKFDGGIQFDGGPGNTSATNDYVELPIGDLISTLASTTVTAWVNWAGTGGAWQRILDFGSGTNNYMFLTPSRSGTNSARFAIRTATVNEQIITAPAILPKDWHHVAIAMDSATMRMTMFVDGAAVVSGATTLLPKDMGVTTQNWIARSQYPDPSYNGGLDDLRIYDRALTQDEVAHAMQGGLGYGVANTPIPANKASDLLRDQVLSWTAGQVAQTHDVYFGTVRDDVANATTAKPLGVLVSPGQAATTYNPGRLAFGTTYYWRVDEVGPAPDFTTYKGNVWSFTIEPFALPIGKASITATASSSNSADMGPQKTVDGSGLNAGDQHSTTETDMWLSAKGGAQPTWIQYAFDKVYSLNTMLVWNSNQALESVVGYGAMGVTVEYSVDGEKWSALSEFQFAQAPGEPTYTANTTVDFGGAPVKFVKLTVNSNWGGLLPQYGLSEVRFSYLPVIARYPSPASGAANLFPQVTMSWRAGREAASHEVYLSTDKQAVTDGTALVATVFAPTYATPVELARTYYWKVNEVNAVESPTTWAGDVWSFSTQEFIRAYTFKNAADRAVSYGTERAFTPVQDWSAGGAKFLVVTFRGALGNAAGKLYVNINGTKVSYGDDADLTKQVLQQWNIDLASLGIDLKNVQSLKIGVDSLGAGTVTLDDLRLFRAVVEPVQPADPGPGALAALYAMEDNADDTSGKGLNAKLVNGPVFVDSLAGMGKALSLDGTNDYVDLPIGSLLASLSDITVATWVNFSGTGGAWQRIWDFGTGSTNYMFLAPHQTATGPMTFAIRTATVNEKRFVAPSTLATGWHHVAVVINSATKTAQLLLDGTVVSSSSVAVLPKDLGNTTQNWIAKSQFPADAYYKGAVDDFRIYSQPLSEGEVRYLAGDR